MRLRYFSFITILFVSALFIIAFLFYQLYAFNQQKNAFSNYERTISLLQRTDIEINAILAQKLTYLDFDNLNAKLAYFNELSTKLQTNPLNKTLKINSKIFYRDLLSDFQQKHQLTEDFKSSNASMLNSMHYLFDLEKKLQQKQDISLQDKRILNGILYNTMNVTLHLGLGYKNIYKLISSLEEHKSKHTNFIYFATHTRLILEKITDLNQVLNEIRLLPIQKDILKLQSSFNQHYKEKQFLQKLIVIVVFVLLGIAIILLFFAYQRVQKTLLELAAFKYAVENSDNTVVITDVDRNITYVNDVFTQTTGYPIQDALGKNPNILKSGLMEEDFYKELNETLNRGETWTGEFINKKQDGSLYYEKASIVPIFVKSELVNYLAIKLDITQYVEQKKRLQLSAAVFEHTMDGIMITDADGIIISINNSLIKMTGYTEEEFIGQNPNILKSGQQDEEFYEDMWQTVLNKGNWKGKIFDRTKKGLLIQTWLSISSIKDDNGVIINYIAIHTDLNELILIQDKIDFMAHHDTLTNLPNRRYLEEHIEQIIHIASREKQNFAILFLDLDRFKIINDTLGHDAGDQLLKVVSRRIKNILRESDILVRTGGDEFIIVVQNIKSKDEPAYISNKILKELEAPFDVQEHQLNISASIGIAIYPEDGKDIATLTKHADSAMYLAKDLGKNNYQYFTEQLSIDIHHRLQLEQSLKHALKNHEFYLHFQPQYNLQTREVVGAEALIRWENQDLGFIAPDVFIPIAEETHMIIPIGEYVFEEACEAFMKWRENGLTVETIAINISSIQLSDKNLLKTFERIVKKVGISPKNIEIEITERYIFKHTANEDTILNDLRNLGFKISIDDFGTGYSSMNYLKRLPLDTIKIDKSFIDDIPEDTNNMEITKAIIALSTSLGYYNIAEGIETVEQENFLKEQGCEIGQGYLFQRPISSDKFIQLCKNCK